MRKHFFILLYVFSFLFIFPTVGKAEEDIGVRILYQVGPSVVRIMVDQGNDSVTIGTGFFINNRYIVTNHHCVSTYLKSSFIGSDGWFKSAKGKDALVIFSEEKEDWSLGIVVEDWPEVDLAVIDIKYGTTKRSPVRIASENDIRNGMDVFVVGFPSVFSNVYDLSTVDEPKITKGNLVSTITHNTYEDGLTDYKQQCYSALINPGNSGGPVVDKNGYVIGIANASINNNGEVGYFGIDFRELTSRLDKAGISYFNADSSYSSFAPISIPEVSNNPPTSSYDTTVKAGEVITFGRYEQDNNLSNGPEEIEWQVLDVENGRALLISKYALEEMSYNARKENVTWETCTLRSWLNKEFYNSAFNDSEKERIIKTNNKNPNNSVYNTNGGNTTTDNIFLLSIDELNQFFPNNDSRICKRTAHIEANRFWSDYDTKWWWLRSPGNESYMVLHVSRDGSSNYIGSYVNDRNGCVRPAFWIDL